MGNPVSPDTQKSLPTSMRRKIIIDFGLFAIFFLFYMGAAIIQTPVGSGIATKVVMGMPFGLLMSLAIFPVSWILIIIWFWKAR